MLHAWLVRRTAVVRSTDKYQVIDGFGASYADFYGPLNSKMGDFFFTTSRVGLSLLLTPVIGSRIRRYNLKREVVRAQGGKFL